MLDQKTARTFVFWAIVIFSTLSWLHYVATRRFLPAGHPWKDRRRTLVEWATHSTPLMHQINLCFWLCTSIAVELIVVVVRHVP